MKDKLIMIFAGLTLTLSACSDDVTKKAAGPNPSLSDTGRVDAGAPDATGGPDADTTQDSGVDSGDAGVDSGDAGVDPNECEPGTFRESADDECKRWTVCEPGEYESASGSALSDRTCAQCPTGTYTDTANATACTEWTSCAPGQRVESSGSETTDRSCSTCEAGTFSDSQNASTCTAWTTCEPGAFIDAAGSSTRDRACTTCPQGTFSTTTNASSCAAWSTCESGHFVDSPGTPTTDRTCATCASGTFSDTANASECTAWGSCNPGQFVESAGSAEEDRTCSNCPSQTFSTTTNASSCSAWTSCSPGQSVDSAGTRTRDRTCSSCPSGTFSSSTNATRCDPWTECVSGTFVSSGGTPVQDRVCTMCPAGTYSDTVNASSCTTWQTCTDGQFVDIDGSATMDRQCSTCPPGTSSRGPNATVCQENCLIALGLSCADFNEAYIKASNPDWNDHFGTSVALDGDTLAVGAYLESSDATGIDGDQSNNDATSAGAVYIFRRSAGTWVQEAYLKPSTSGSGKKFGFAVSLDGDTLAVGAPEENSSARGIDGDESNTNAVNSGAVYVFKRSGSTWNQEAYIKASNTDARDQFGYSLDLDGDSLAVGARYEQSNATGINGNQFDNSKNWSGAAYVFTRSGATWTQQAYLKASNADADDTFGRSVALSGDTLAVGAPREDSNASGINQDQSDNSLSWSGAVYVFERSGSSWSQQAYIKASNSDEDDYFGTALSLDGETLVVGVPDEESNATGVNGNQSNNSAPSSGAVYVFTRSGSTWSQQAYLKASNTDIGDDFGLSVSINGDTLAVGAAREDSTATGVDGDQGNDGASSSGAVYLFTRTGGIWTQQAYIKASNTDQNDRFGGAIALDGDTLAIGASSERSNAAGINGNQSNNSFGGAGAVYVRKIAP